MSIPGVTPITRIAPTIADPPTAAPAVRPITVATAVEIDRITQLPIALRFPWLSRLSQQLEPVAKQKPAFPSAPILGDNVDRSV